MARRYVQIWNRIKTDGSATITVSKDAARTVINGVKESKTIENTSRRKLDMIGWSRLIITKKEISPTHISVKFEFVYPTDI